MLYFIVSTLLLGICKAEDYLPIKPNEFQIQGVIIEAPKFYRYKRQFQSQQPFYRQNQSPSYLERPYPQQKTIGQSLPQAQTNFAQNYRQPLPQTLQQPPFRPPQPQHPFQSPNPQYQPQTWGGQPQTQSWVPKQRVFNDVNNLGPGQSKFHYASNLQQGEDQYNGARYYYPPKQPFPLPKCFYNPTGYVCCNQHLNDLIVDTYTELDKRPKFHTCNVNALAFHIQQRAERRFNHTFEAIAAYDDFAQKIHFDGDMVCKVELGGKYMLAYATVKEVMDPTLRPLPLNNPIAGLPPFRRTHVWKI